jgi:hypothetical protein
VALSFAVVGCYTILKHPVTSEEGPQKERADAHPQEYYRQNCIDCHADYSEFPYGYFYGDYPDYYFEYPRWGYYYAYPWWWDRHWYDESPVEDGGGIVEGEKAHRRGNLIPPYVTGSTALNTGGGGGGGGGGYVAPGNSQTGGKTPTGGSTGGAGGEQPEKTRVRMSGSNDSTQTPDSTEKESNSTKATRRGGKKP